eukprot:SAG11_NODE_3178_length_2629_cov_5.173123_4_plen_114_part_00
MISRCEGRRCPLHRTFVEHFENIIIRLVQGVCLLLVGVLTWLLPLGVGQHQDVQHTIDSIGYSPQDGCACFDELSFGHACASLHGTIANYGNVSAVIVCYELLIICIGNLQTQ